jgi:hypothetical protein
MVEVVSGTRTTVVKRVDRKGAKLIDIKTSSAEMDGAKDWSRFSASRHEDRRRHPFNAFKSLQVLRLTALFCLGSIDRHRSGNRRVYSVRRLSADLGQLLCVPLLSPPFRPRSRGFSVSASQILSHYLITT